MKTNHTALLAVSLCLLGCGGPSSSPNQSVSDTSTMNTFSQDVAFLKQYINAIVLGNGPGKIVVVPEYQARVMTSTTGGERDPSFGWMNYDLIEQGIRSREEAKGTLEEHIHIFGGEERFWLGPEGGQFAIFFKPGSAFEFSDWFTPALIDTEPFDEVSVGEAEASYRKDFEFQNFSGTRFKGRTDRRISVLDATRTAEAQKLEGMPDGLASVAYQTHNTLSNTSDTAWTREGGLLSIWLLGMYQPSERTTVVIPFMVGSEEDLGPIVNDSYFGKVPAERLVVKDGALFFSGDGKHRSKIGITAQRSKGIAGKRIACTLRVMAT